MNSVTHQSIPPTRVSTSRRISSTNPSMGAKAICMKNTLNEKRAAVYWISREIAEPCRSEPARDEPESAAGCQVPSVIVDDHREHARSYRGGVRPGLAAPGHSLR